MLDRVGMFVRPRVSPRTVLAERLGCELIEDGMISGLIRVDDTYQTTASGVYAIGDVATPIQRISSAVMSGAVAGAMLNHALIAEDYAWATSELSLPAA